MWWRRSWFSLKGKAGIPGQTEGRPATSIGPRVPPVGSLQQRDAVPEPPRAGSLPHSRDPPATAAPLLESSSTARSRAAAHSLRACACVTVPASLVIEPSATSDEEGKLLGNVPS